MALDLNIPATEDEEDEPFGGLPNGNDRLMEIFVVRGESNEWWDPQL
jgi:hypothetical protein